MILSGPAFAFGIVKSLKIFAAFLASDFRLLGIGVLTILSSHKWILFYKNLKTRSRSNSYRPQMKFGARQFFTRVCHSVPGESLSKGVSVQWGVSVQGVCPRGSLSRGCLYPGVVSFPGGSLSRGGLCQGDPRRSPRTVKSGRYAS